MGFQDLGVRVRAHANYPELLPSGPGYALGRGLKLLQFEPASDCGPPARLRYIGCSMKRTPPPPAGRRLRGFAGSGGGVLRVHAGGGHASCVYPHSTARRIIIIYGAYGVAWEAVRGGIESQGYLRLGGPGRTSSHLRP